MELVGDGGKGEMQPICVGTTQRHSRSSYVFTAQMQAKVRHGGLGRAMRPVVAALFGTLVGLATLATAEVTCRPNIFGGQDCAGEGIESTSRPNIFGGYDTTYGDGARTTSRRNIFGGKDTNGPGGTVTSQPNIFGGEDYRLPDGETVASQPNIFGGRDYRTQDGKTITCRPVAGSLRSLTLRNE